MTSGAAPAAGALDITLAGEAVQLLGARALWWPREATLFVADVHLGKAQSFRRLGVPVPAGSSADTLARLGALVVGVGAQRLVCLGDLWHAAAAHDAGPAAQLRAWRAAHAGLDLWLVEGNHDARAGAPPVDLGLHRVDEGARLGPWALCHHPQAVDGAHALAGHVHPCISLGARARDRLRLPCFHVGAACTVLPAFGGFTGMHPVQCGVGERAYVIADGAVHPLP